MKYDIIGDVHGYPHELEQLLIKLGYNKIEGVWQHSSRKCIFVGDIINRGPDSRRVLRTVKNMVENDKAYCILGNNEINLIVALTKDPDTGKPFKKLSVRSQRRISNLKKQFKNYPEDLKDYVKWLRKQPLFLDFGDFRVVHAYWSNVLIDHIKDADIHKKISKHHLAMLNNSSLPFTKAVKFITKGLEVRMPHNLQIKDADNNKCDSFRMKWWENPKDKTFRDLSYGAKSLLPKYTVPKELIYDFEPYGEDEPILFVGHYSVKDDEMIPQKNICCVDSGIAQERSLSAYRYDGEKELDPSKIVSCSFNDTYTRLKL